MYNMTPFEKVEFSATWHLLWQVAKMPQNSQNIDFQTTFPKTFFIYVKFPFQRCITWPLLRTLIFDPSGHTSGPFPANWPWRKWWHQLFLDPLGVYNNNPKSNQIDSEVHTGGGPAPRVIWWEGGQKSENLADIICERSPIIRSQTKLTRMCTREVVQRLEYNSGL